MQPTTAAPSLFLCEAEWEAPLKQDLASLGLEQIHTAAPCWVKAIVPPASALAGLSVAFASQCLYDAEALSAPSISQWSRQAAGRIVEQLSRHAGPWRLQVYSRYAPGDDSGHRRATLVRQSLLAALKGSQRRLLRSLHEEMSPCWRPDEALVQLGLASPTEGFLSVAQPGVLHLLRRAVSRFPAGIVPLAAQPHAPSRAFHKLAEVELRMDRRIAPGETCVDLGSSPGSWAWLALQRGARVVAVDRSALREDLMRHANLSFVRGDAFKYQPPAVADWLLSDIIAFPARILRLLDDWLNRGWCRRFCVTIKFRGAEEYPVLTDFRAMLDEQNVDYAQRRLTYNRNEVTVYGVVRDQSHAFVGC
jgi:23S rRNA (cytidine2498-2'-O)-methyltransferase